MIMWFRLNRCWWWVLATLYIGDSFEISLTNSLLIVTNMTKKVPSIKILHLYYRHIKIVTNIYAPTSLEPTVYVYTYYWSSHGHQDKLTCTLHFEPLLIHWPVYHMTILLHSQAAVLSWYHIDLLFRMFSTL